MGETAVTSCALTRILLIDADVDDVARFTTEAERDSLLCEVTPVESPADACPQCAHIRFDVVILDPDTVQGDIGETITTIKQAAGNTPVAVLAQHEDESVMQAAMDAGAHGFFVKGQQSVASLLRSIRFAHLSSKQQLSSVNKREATSWRVQDLVRANSELEQFAYIASHDLQQPLRVVTSYLQLLERHCRSKLDDSAMEFIEFARQAADRMRTLITDLLAYSRAGSNQLNPVETDCAEEIANVMKDIGDLIDESGARITFDVMPTIKADRTQLRQLFQNLLANSIKYRGQSSPQIHCTARRESDHWVFSITDNGVGIDDDQADRIFTMFNQIENDGRLTGNGLGLAICKRIVERHGGRIWVERNPQGGSVFLFTIPFLQERNSHECVVAKPTN